MDSENQKLNKKLEAIELRDIRLLRDIGKERYHLLSELEKELLDSVFDCVDIGKIDNPDDLFDSARENVYNEDNN